jgi:hypothetical protein
MPFFERQVFVAAALLDLCRPDCEDGDGGYDEKESWFSSPTAPQTVISLAQDAANSRRMPVW